MELIAAVHLHLLKGVHDTIRLSVNWTYRAMNPSRLSRELQC